jgi:DNA polymerase
MKRSTQAKMHMKSLRESRGSQKRLVEVDVNVELSKLRQQLQLCQKCGLCNLKENKTESGECFGKLVLNNLHKTIFKPTVLFLGQNPSYRRFDKELRAFRGVDETATLSSFKTSGDLFRLCLEKSELKDYDIWVDNLVHCSSEENSVPTTEQIDACFEWLEKEIEFLNPKAIICMGNETYENFTARFKGKRVIKIWHPAYLMHGNLDKIPDFIKQLNELRQTI